jgi:tRNA pseudouridine38-40 synthase
VTLFDPEETTTAPAEPSFRVRLLVAYDGRPFRGFAAQREGVRTVGGDLGAAVAKVLGHSVDLTCAGRTDAGVHAWGQVVTFDAAGTPDEVDLCGLQRSLNKMLAPHVAIREAAPAPSDFDARFSATWRAYRYTVLNRPVPDPFLAATAWHVEAPLDLRAMRLACDPLVGEHDFAAFCRRPVPEASLVRRVIEADWLDLGDGVLRFDVRASAFCHQMVRSMVGLLVSVGRGRKRAGDVAGIVRDAARAGAGSPAPPHGLCLWEVGYGETSSGAVFNRPMSL